MKVKHLFEENFVGVYDIGGDYLADHSGITSLEGLPEVIEGSLSVSRNYLDTLEHSPREIKGHFDCSGNRLRSLKGGPEKIHRALYCANNQLRTLEGAPSFVGATLKCDNNELVSLKGAPPEVGMHFICGHNRLFSLEGIPSKIGGILQLNNNSLTSLKNVHKHIKEVNGTIDISNNPIKSHLLGVLLIKGVESLLSTNNKKAVMIINKYLRNSVRDMEAVLECQEELINAGFDKIAQL